MALSCDKWFDESIAAYKELASVKALVSALSNYLVYSLKVMHGIYQVMSLELSFSIFCKIVCSAKAAHMMICLKASK